MDRSVKAGKDETMATRLIYGYKVKCDGFYTEITTRYEARALRYQQIAEYEQGLVCSVEFGVIEKHVS